VKLVTRKAWGAKPAREKDALVSGLRGVAVHYSGMDADEEADHANCAARVRGIQRYHQQTQGWLDIAYSHLLCCHGYVFEGRGFGVRTAANGTNAANSAFFAICFLGNDDPEKDFTDEARDALVELRREYLKRYPNAKLTVGHRDVKQTACPGDEIYGFIHSHPFRAALEVNRRLPGPSPKPAWWWAWAEWRLTGRRGPRPAATPLPVPGWAWDALAAFQNR
jgi:N-acetylmuramoyl-L-alanine amidase